MRAVPARYLINSAFLAAAIGLATPVHALSIDVQQFTVASFDGILAGLGSSKLENFEMLGSDTCIGGTACETGGSLGTSVGTFVTLGGTGTGDSVVGSGEHLSLKTAASGNAFGRSNTTPGGAWWLDSNDTFGIDWSVNTGETFDRIAFVLSDVADVGATLSVSADGQFLANILNQTNGALSLVLISFSEAVLTANIELRNNVLNDGFGIDDALVGRVAPVPLPAAGLLLLGGLGGLVALRRRKRI